MLVEPFELEQISLGIDGHEAVVRAALSKRQLTPKGHVMSLEMCEPRLEVLRHDGQRDALRLVCGMHSSLRVDQRKE